MSKWVDILEYRDFHDVPRIFVIKVDGKNILFDCPFDEQLDEYSDEYIIYQLGEMFSDAPPDDWTGLSRQAVCCLGRVAVDGVVFDSTKRKQVKRSVVADLLV